MNEEAIKNTLSIHLKKIPTEDFNEKIIQQLKVSKEKKKLILFDQKSIFSVFFVISLFVLGIHLDIYGKLSLEGTIAGILICISPLFFMTYNKIFQIATKYQNHENRI